MKKLLALVLTLAMVLAMFAGCGAKTEAPAESGEKTLLLGLIGSVAGQVGDLTASLLKRYTGIKDYGSIFPGHGGVMDRFDSVIFVLIVMYCYTLVL